MVLPRVFDANGFCLLEYRHIRDENGLGVEITWTHQSGDTFKIKVGIPHDAFRKVFRSTPILIVNGTRCCVQFGDFITGETTLPDSLLPASTRQTPIDIGEFGYSNVVREVGTSIGSTLVENKSLIAQQYPDLTCACCTNKITHPQWIDRYLGGEINKYLDACSEMGQTPQVFCCNCMPAIQRNPTVMNHWREIQAQVHEFSTRLYALEQRERDIKKREEELDKQLGIS